MAQTHSLDLERSSSQFASITDASQTNLDITTDFSVEAWIKLEALPSTPNIPMGIVAKFASAVGFRVSIINTDFIRIYYGNGSETQIDSSAAYVTAADVGRWIHFAVSVDISARTMSLYKNGQSVATTLATAGDTTIGNNSADFWVGRIDGNQWYFDGLIKDIRVFNDIRTQTEIVADAHTQDVSDANLVGEWNLNNAYTDSSGNGNTLTASGSPVFSTDIPWTAPAAAEDSTSLTTSLVSWWAMEETSGNRSDSYGSNTLVDNNTVGSATGIIGSGADFEATSSEYFSVADNASLSITGDIAMSAWVNLESSPSSNAKYFILVKGGATGEVSYEFDYRNNAGTFQLQFLNNSGTSGATEDEFNFNSTLTTATYHHVVASWDASASTCEMFVDGISLGTVTTDNTSMYDGTLAFALGSSVAGGGAFFDGVIDETAIWSKTLNYGDVLDLYKAGSGITFVAPVTVYTVSTSDTLTVTESVTVQVVNHVSVFDALTVVDVVGYYEELLVVSEFVTVELITGTSISVTDTLTITESVTVQLVHNVSVVDRLALDEGPLASSTVITSDVLSPGTMATDAAVGNTAWSLPDNAKVSDNIYATATTSNVDGGYTIRDTTIKIVKSDGTIGTTNKGNNTALETTDTYRTYGGTSDLWGETWAASDINDGDFGVVSSYELEYLNGTAVTHYLKATNFGFAIPASAVVVGIKVEVEAKGITTHPDFSYYGTVYVDHIRATVYYTAGSPQVEVQSFVSVVDSVAAAEVVSLGQLSVEPSIFDTLTVTESVSVTQIHNVSVVDTISIAETVTPEVVNNSSVVDVIGITESLAVELVNDISVVDTLSIIESVTNSTQSYVSVFDTLTLDEAHTVLSIGATIAIFVTDDLSIAEETTFFFDLLTISISDDLSIVEVITNDGQLSVSVTDALSVVEDYAIELVSLVSVIETISITEDLSVESIFNVSSVDTLSVTEDVAQTLIFGVSVVDTISIAESVVDSIDSYVSIYDDVLISESITTDILSTVSIVDTISVQEDVAVEVPVNISTEDTLTISESVTTELFLNVSVSDLISVSEDIQTDTTAFVSVIETISITESVSIGIVSLISVTETISIAENLTVESIRYSPQIPSARPRGAGQVFTPRGTVG